MYISRIPGRGSAPDDHSPADRQHYRSPLVKKPSKHSKPTSVESGGRAAQRRRTRRAILAAASRLLADGHSPSIAEIAAAADVSRRTVYMYFPTLEQLFVDATLETISQAAVDSAIDAPEDDGETDVAERAERMARAVQRMAAETEQQGRALMRLTAAPRAEPRREGVPPRGYRRVEWIERAIAPLRGRVSAAEFERLVSALSLVVGWEALIVERDIRALSLIEAENVSAWAARALVRATITESARRRKKR
jgi:AcrR family transcriptional regulator